MDFEASCWAKLNVVSGCVFCLFVLFLNTVYFKRFLPMAQKQKTVAASAVCLQNYKKPYTCHLPNDSAIFTTELCACLLSLRHVCHSQENSCLILSDSLSLLQAMHNKKYDHPILTKKSGTTFRSVFWWEGDYFCLGPWPCQHWRKFSSRYCC